VDEFLVLLINNKQTITKETSFKEYVFKNLLIFDV